MDRDFNFHAILCPNNNHQEIYESAEGQFEVAVSFGFPDSIPDKFDPDNRRVRRD